MLFSFDRSIGRDHAEGSRDFSERFLFFQHDNGEGQHKRNRARMEVSILSAHHLHSTHFRIENDDSVSYVVCVFVPKVVAIVLMAVMLGATGF